jgi:hypothetical protein
LGYWNSADNVQLVSVPAEEKIIAEIEILFFAMAGESVKNNASASLATFLTPPSMGEYR